MAANDIYEVVLRGQLSGIGADYNVFHVKDMGGSGDIASVPQALLNLYTATILGQLPNDLSWNEASYAKVSPAPRGPQIIVAVAKAGTSGTDYAPQTSMVIKWATAVGGRSGRGRSYIGPPIESSATKGVLAGSIHTALQTMADGFVAAYGVGGSEVADFEMGVWSRKLGLFYGITAGVARSIIYTQRRRIPGMGI